MSTCGTLTKGDRSQSCLRSGRSAARVTNWIRGAGEWRARCGGRLKRHDYEYVLVDER